MIILNFVDLIDEVKTYELIKAMFNQWRKIVKTDKFHIGMDVASFVDLGNGIFGNGERIYECI